MAFPPSVLLLDDGELGDVRRLLDDLEVDYVHLRGASISDGLEAPRDLLLTTTRRAQAIPRGPNSDAGPVRVVVASEDAETLRDRLRRNGVDFLVRRPVHSEALRLLVLRALYRGPEKRRGVRVPFGVPVECRLGSLRTDAVLAELSTGGCRVIVPRTSQPVPPGAGVVVTIPPDDDGGEPLSMFGMVLRIHEEDDHDDMALAIEFDPLDEASEEALIRTLMRRVVSHAESPSERREHPRRSFDQTVKALTVEASRALVGRDVSLGGMRVDPHPDLKTGDAVTLEIYGMANGQVSEVHATVVRDDGPDGMALRFDHVTPDVARRLEALVTSLPSIEPLRGGEAAAMGAVVSRIVGEG